MSSISSMKEWLQNISDLKYDTPLTNPQLKIKKKSDNLLSGFRKLKVLLLLTSLFFYFTGICREYKEGTDTTGTTELNKPPSPPIKADSIIKIVNINSQHDTIRIDETLAIKLRTEKPISSFRSLFVNGIKINKLSPIDSSAAEKTIFFKLDESVADIIEEKFLGEKPTNDYLMPVYFAAGDSTATVTAKTPIYIIIKQKIRTIWVVIMSGILIFLTVLALTKNVLKDDNNLYYSLGRSQLFYWTILFSICYLSLCFKTNSLPDIPGSMLVILGISAGTTAAAKLVENRNKEKIKIDPSAKSEGFLIDILSDGSSINIHRFQNVVFNLAFGLIFIQKSFSTYLIPSFDDNILLLLGISSATYAGLKITEATKEQNVPPPQVGTDTAKPDKKDDKPNTAETEKNKPNENKS